MVVNPRVLEGCDWPFPGIIQHKTLNVNRNTFDSFELIRMIPTAHEPFIMAVEWMVTCISNRQNRITHCTSNSLRECNFKAQFVEGKILTWV